MKLHELTPISFFKVAKLHEIERERGYQITIFDEISRVEDKNSNNPDEVLLFSHLDGSYSVCYAVNNDKTIDTNSVINLAGFQDVVEVPMHEFLTFKQIRQLIGRSGYGKDGKGEYTNRKLSEMSDAWVSNSIDFVEETHPHRKFYIEELKYRKDNNIIIED